MSKSLNLSIVVNAAAWPDVVEALAEIARKAKSGELQQYGSICVHTGSLDWVYTNPEFRNKGRVSVAAAPQPVTAEDPFN